MSQSLTPAQQAQLSAFIASPAFLNLPEGRARANAANNFLNQLTGAHAPTFGDSGGFLQAIPGQPGWETTATRIAGAIAGGVMLAPALGIGGAAAGGTTAGGTAAAAGGTAAGGGISATSLIAPTVGALGSVYGAKQQAGSANHAADLQATAAQKALDYTRQADAQKRADEIAAQNASYAQWGVDENAGYDRYLAHHNAVTPYNALGLSAGNTLAGMLGLPGINTTPAGAAPRPVLPPPPTFTTIPPQQAGS